MTKRTMVILTSSRLATLDKKSIEISPLSTHGQAGPLLKLIIIIFCIKIFDTTMHSSFLRSFWKVLKIVRKKVDTCFSYNPTFALWCVVKNIRLKFSQRYPCLKLNRTILIVNFVSSQIQSLEMSLDWICQKSLIGVRSNQIKSFKADIKSWPFVNACSILCKYWRSRFDCRYTLTWHALQSSNHLLVGLRS